MVCGKNLDSGENKMSELVEKVEDLASEGKAEVEAVEKKVEAAVNTVAKVLDTATGEVTHVAKGAVIAITAEEKLAIRELENKFLKTQMEITRLQNIAQEVQKNFPALIEQLKQKYVVDPATYVFDSIKLEFLRK